MFANEGNLIIQNTDASGGVIDIASGADLTGYTDSNPSFGYVNIVVGPIPSMPVIGDVPENVVTFESGGGVIYFGGTNSINAASPNNTINAKGRDVVFSGPEGSITLGGDVTITADPPERLPTTPSIESGEVPNFMSMFMNTSTLTSSTLATERSAGIATTVIPFDSSPASSVNTSVVQDTIGNVVNQALEQSGILNGAPQVKEEDQEKEKNPYQPISYSPSVANFAKFTPVSHGHSLCTLGTSGTSIKCLGGAKVYVDDANVVEVRKGEALIAPTRKATTVVAGDVRITLQPSSIITVEHEGHSVKVRTLYEPDNTSVSVVIEGKIVNIGVGQELVVAANEGELHLALKNDNVGRRRIKSHPIGNRHIATSELSLISFMEANPILNQIVHSQEQEDKALVDRLVKMAACLMVSTTSHGAYNEGLQK
jgi:hypothetical protein